MSHLHSDHPEMAIPLGDTPRTDAEAFDAIRIAVGRTIDLSVVSADFARQLERENADALEENARLRAELGKFSDRNGYALRQRAESAEAELAKLRTAANDDDALRERMANILTRTAAALKGEPGPLTLHDWSGLPEIAERAASDLAKLRHAVDLAARAMHGEGVDDQAQAWDVCLRILDAARADFPDEK